MKKKAVCLLFIWFGFFFFFSQKHAHVLESSFKAKKQEHNLFSFVFTNVHIKMSV